MASFSAGSTPKNGRRCAGAASCKRAIGTRAGGSQSQAGRDPSGSDPARRAAQFGSIQSVASSFGVEVSPIDTRDAGEIAHAINAFALNPDGGLIFVSNRQSMPS